MGVFSFMYADTNNTENLKIGGSAYVCCPDGTFIKEPHYGGYGNFAGHDIYELLVDWNKEYLSADSLTAPSEEEYTKHSNYERAFSEYQEKLRQIQAFKEFHYDSEKMNSLFGDEWKRELGIALFFSDVVLKYPMKISKDKVPYDSLPASKDDPLQGYYD